MKLTLSAQVGAAYLPFLRKHLRRAVAALEAMDSPSPARKLVEVSIILVNDVRMSRLHAQFLGISTTTDVLSFPLDSDFAGHVTAGEVYLCVPEARRQAKARGIDVAQELLLYALHGMLHLLGYDDRTHRAHRLMHGVEDMILTKLGFGPLFSAPVLLARPRGAR